MQRHYDATCHRERFCWVIEITSWSKTEGERWLGVTQARVGRRGVARTAEEFVRLVLDLDDEESVDLRVWGAHFWQEVIRDRWQYHAPWGVTRPWLPRMFLGSDERGNESISAVVPPFGWFVLFFRPRLNLRDLTYEEAEAFEEATPSWWTPAQAVLKVAAIPLYLVAFGLAARAVWRMRR